MASTPPGDEFVKAIRAINAALGSTLKQMEAFNTVLKRLNNSNLALANNGDLDDDPAFARFCQVLRNSSC